VNQFCIGFQVLANLEEERAAAEAEGSELGQAVDAHGGSMESGESDKPTAARANTPPMNELDQLELMSLGSLLQVTQELENASAASVEPPATTTQ
jgi:hypothetical protein